LPSALIWLSDSTEIGSCGTDAAATTRPVPVPVAGPVPVVVGTGVVAAGRDACRLAGPQAATSKVPIAAAAAAAAKLIERMLAIFGSYGQVVMGRSSQKGRAPHLGGFPLRAAVVTVKVRCGSVRQPGEGRMGGNLTSEPVSGIEPLTCRLQDGCSAY
jgi:hypothetical protein